LKLCFTSSRALAALYQSDFVCRKNRIEQLGKSLLQLIYVKKPERVAVLGDLFFLVLAIYRVFQRRVRQFITPERPLQGVGGRKWTRPTGQTIFSIVLVCQSRPVGTAGWANPTQARETAHP
jgi:hypothetical protein